MGRGLEKADEMIKEPENSSMEIKKQIFIDNTIKTNNRVKRLVFYSNATGPLIFFGVFFHFFIIEYYEAIEIFIYTLLISFFLWCLNKKVEWYDFTKFASLILIEILIGMMIMNASIGIYISLGFVPIISCLYVDELLTIFMNLYCYIILAISLYFRAQDYIGTFGSRLYTVKEWYINYLLGYTIEFIFVYLITKSIVKYEKDLMENLEEQTRKQYKAEQLSEVRMTFFSKMSHELRTPLNAICGLTDLLRAKPLEKEDKEYVETISASGKTMLTMINSILDISKMNADKLNIKEERYNIWNVIKDSMQIALFSIKNEKISFIKKIDAQLPEYLIGDEIGISRILVNLLHNALKFTKEGSITLTVLWKEDEGRGGILSIEVKDTGSGIKQNELRAIFEDYVQGDNAQYSKYMGTGLGLTVCRNYAESMGGKISVESEYGSGSTFFVEIPQKSCDEADDLNEQENSRLFQPSFCAPDARIMVVDDNKTNIQVVLSLMKCYQFKITPCLNGEKALELLQRDLKFDLILMDHLMPGMDGIETTIKIREQIPSLNSKVPIIALSANLVGDLGEKFLKNGMDDILEKPIDRNKLDKTLKKWLPDEKCKLISEENKDGKSI